jgi:hypothetical protein
MAFSILREYGNRFNFRCSVQGQQPLNLKSYPFFFTKTIYDYDGANLYKSLVSMFRCLDSWIVCKYAQSVTAKLMKLKLQDP